MTSPPRTGARPSVQYATPATGPTVADVADRAVDDWRDLTTALADPVLRARVHAAGEAVVAAALGGGALLVAGNGGSAAIASHVAAEFLGKCVRDRSPLPAVSLAESTAAVTAVGNDYGFEEVFARGVVAHGRPGDVLLAMSTSGQSRNVLRALEEARERGLTTILMTGRGAPDLTARAEHVLVVPSTSVPRIQEVHLLWSHAWCEAVDHAVADHG